MILWLNPVAGLSGDMLLGALLDLGAPLDAVRESIESTGVRGWQLTVEPVRRCGARARHALVTVADDVAVRRAADVMEVVAAASPASVGHLAAEAVRLMAVSEARVHEVPLDAVHLHELGSVDTIVDTVGVAAAIHALHVTEVWSSPIALGTGMTSTAHGTLPVPAPATLELLVGCDVAPSSLPGETVTPTGAALLAALGCRFGAAPPMTVVGVGYGAGTRDPAAYPNVLPAVLGRPTADGGLLEDLVVVETNVDDVTGETLGAVLKLLLADGALDAWIAPVLGKKGRPAQVVSVLCRPDTVETLERCLLRETGSLGARRSRVRRRALPRTVTTVEIDGIPVRVKRGPYGAKPEHDDVIVLARDAQISLREAAERVCVALASEDRV
jgi:hypothetical protein